jgi:hypothetical protein
VIAIPFLKVLLFLPLKAREQPMAVSNRPKVGQIQSQPISRKPHL